MMGSFLTRALIMALGYAYPAYECFKTVEKNKPEIGQLRFWCQYWWTSILENFDPGCGIDNFRESWRCFHFLGTTYVYDSFLRPYITKHENEIDRNLLELRTRAGDVIVLYWQKAATYGQTRFFELLQYVASQSQPPRPNPAQRRTQQVRQPPPPVVPPHQPATQQQRPHVQLQQSQQPIPRAPSSPVKNQAKEIKQEAVATSTQEVVSTSTQATPAGANAPPAEAAGSSKQSEPEHMQVEAVPSHNIQDRSVPANESVIEETIRVTRARLRKTRTAPASASASH